jgi:hypothetical protein
VVAFVVSEYSTKTVATSSAKQLTYSFVLWMWLLQDKTILCVIIMWWNFAIDCSAVLHAPTGLINTYLNINSR